MCCLQAVEVPPRTFIKANPRLLLPGWPKECILAQPHCITDRAQITLTCIQALGGIESLMSLSKQTLPPPNAPDTSWPLIPERRSLLREKLEWLFSLPRDVCYDPLFRRWQSVCTIQILFFLTSLVLCFIKQRNYKTNSRLFYRKYIQILLSLNSFCRAFSQIWLLLKASKAIMQLFAQQLSTLVFTMHRFFTLHWRLGEEWHYQENAGPKFLLLRKGVMGR